MRNHSAVIVKYSTIVVAGIVGAWAQIPYLIQVLLGLMACDFLSGIFVAASKHCVRSETAFQGLMKKGMILVMIAALHMIEEPLHVPFDIDHLAAIAFILYELMSLIENAADLGLPVPVVLIEFLAKARMKTATPDEIRDAFREKRETVVAKPDGSVITNKTETTSSTTIALPPKPPQEPQAPLG